MKRQLELQNREISNLREQVARQQALLLKADPSESTSVPGGPESTSGTEAVPDAREEDAQAPAGFAFHDLAGENIQLAHDGRLATRIRGCRRGAVFSRTPLAEGVTASIEVVASVDGWNGALAIGVTGTDPATLDVLPEKVWTIPDTVLVGYCGRVRSSDEAEEDVSWRSEELAEKDVVSVLIDERGMMVLSVNNRVEVELELGLPNKPRFLVVDVYGRTTAVRMLELGTQGPPRSPAPKASGPNSREEFASPPRSPAKSAPPVRLSHWLSDFAS
jgi:hypothetical protein